MSPEEREILIRIDERVGVLIGTQEDQEVRIRKLERFRNWSAGLAASLGGFFGLSEHLK